ncbi:MAG: hypothetical protein ACRD5L_03800 [Bryobacteraceae bacterium]
MKLKKASALILFALAMTATLATLAPPAHAGSLSNDIIALFPKNVGEFAYADLRQARQFPWFGQLKEQMLPARFRQFEQFLASAGIDPNTQVEELAWGLVPTGMSSTTADSAVPTGEQVVGVAMGQFNAAAAQTFFKTQKLATVQQGGFTLYAFGGGTGASDLFFVFIDSSTAAFGQRSQLERLIAVRNGSEESLLRNDKMFPLINEANGQGIVWSVLNAAYTRLAIQQLAPQTAQLPQANDLMKKMTALRMTVQGSSNVQADFEAVCATAQDATTLSQLLQAGLMLQRYQASQTNPDLAKMLDSARISPNGNRLQVLLALTNDQVASLIRSNTFSVKM